MDNSKKLPASALGGVHCSVVPDPEVEYHYQPISSASFAVTAAELGSAANNPPIDEKSGE